MVPVKPSLSPSMDIQGTTKNPISSSAADIIPIVASNMERFLFHLSGNDAAEVRKWMATFQSDGLLVVPESVHQRACEEVTSVAASGRESFACEQCMY